jgi:hypothetical protein
MWEKLEKVHEFGSDYFAHRRGRQQWWGPKKSQKCCEKAVQFPYVFFGIF